MGLVDRLGIGLIKFLGGDSAILKDDYFIQIASDPQAVLEFQRNRPNQVDPFLRRVLAFLGSPVYEAILGPVTLEVITHREEGIVASNDFSAYTLPKERVTYASAPHLKGTSEVLSIGRLTYLLHGQDQLTFFLSKIENFSGGIYNQLVAYIGGFPITRGIKGSLPKKEEYTFFRDFVRGQQHVAMAITGTRTPDGRFGFPQSEGEVHPGLEKIIRAHLTQEDIIHTVVPVSVSADEITGRLYLSVSEPISLSQADLEGRFKERGSLTAEIERITSTSMKVTYNHVACAYLRRERLVQISEAKAAIDRVYEKIREGGQVNLEFCDTDAAWARFLDYSLKHGVTRIRNILSMYPCSIEDYTEKVRASLRKDSIVFDTLSYDEQGHYLRGFAKVHPLDYMANVVGHILQQYMEV